MEEWYVKQYDEYVKLFENSGDALAVGESSADTAYFHRGSIPVIKKYLGDPKIIIMLRNPVKRACSAYQHLVRDEREALPFVKALHEERHRIKNNWELIYHYTAASHYYEPVKAFMDNFTHVKVILNEDLEKKPTKTLREIFLFLGLDPDVSIQTELRYNMSGIPKLRWLHYFLTEENSFRKMIRPFVRCIFPHNLREKISITLQKNNLKRMMIDSDLQKKLAVLFRDDIRKLESLLRRDLSFWLEEKY